MTSCLGRRHVILGGASLALAARPALSQSLPALHAALRAANAFDPYVSDGLGEIVGALGRTLGVRGGATVNALPNDSGIMVCVLRAERERGPLPTGIDVQPGLAASPRADPARRIVWVDADYLRALAVRISLTASPGWGGEGLGSVAAVARTMLAPPPALPKLWQPETSPALRHPTLLLQSRGAAGFVLAHEMAHVLDGPAPPPATEPRELPTRARQLAPMCPSLASPQIAARRAYEERADQRALDAVLAAGDPVGRAPIGLPGELGIGKLLALTLGEDIVRIWSMVEGAMPQRLLLNELGPDVLARLREQTPLRLPGSDLVRLVYSESHPAAAQRLLGAMRELSRRPGSMRYGRRNSEYDAMAQLAEQGCAEAMRSMRGP